MPALNNTTLSRAPTMVQLGHRVLGAMGLVAIVLVCLWLWLSWQQYRDNQQHRQAENVALIAAHADNYFQLISHSLETIAQDLQDPGAPQDNAGRHRLLNQIQERHPELIGTALYDAGGRLLVWAGKEAPHNHHSLDEPAQRAEFEDAFKTPRLHIGRPAVQPDDHQMVILLRLAVRDTRGRASLILQTELPLSAQQQLWLAMSEQPDISIGLLRTDGYLISRVPDGDRPDLYQKQHLKGALYLASRQQPAKGIYDGTTADGTTRYGSYQLLDHYPVLAFISLPRARLITIWWESVRLPVYLILGFMIIGIGFFLFSARRYARNMQVVREQLVEGSDAPLPSSGVQEIDTLCTALAETRQKLRESARNRERQLLLAAQGGTYTVRVRDNHVIAADQNFLRMLVKRPDDVIDQPWLALVADEMAPETGDLFASESEMAHRIVPFRCGDGQIAWLSLTEYEERDTDGQTLRQGLAIDVSEREHLLAKVRGQSDRFKALWQAATHRSVTGEDRLRLMLRLAVETLHMDCGMLTRIDGERLIIEHTAGAHVPFEAGLSFQTSDTLCQHTFEQGGSLFITDLGADPRYLHHPLHTEAGIRTYASSPVWVGDQMHGTLVFLSRGNWTDFDEDDRAFVELLAQWFGMMEREQDQIHVLEDMALTDSLTRLPNRRAAEQRFAAELARARRDGLEFSLAICDLDRFKLINDHYGHDVGDEVLVEVAALMQRELREGDWVARWGGEEFIVFLHHSGAKDSFLAMNRLRETLRATPIHTSQGDMQVTTSIGIGTLRSANETIGDILAEADGCLYDAKKAGRDCVIITASTGHGTLWKAGMLQHALREDRLIAAYQPMVDLATGRMVADEALARLRQPDGTIVAAGEFIEAAEGINLIHHVDNAIARQAMGRCAIKLRDGLAQPDMLHFVNLSAQFLARRDLVMALLNDAQTYCTTCGVQFGATKPIVFEITERDLVSNLTMLEEDLKPLVDFGFQIALDDFGSGYSSFLYLARLPVKFLKIEGWMVQNLLTDRKVRHIVEGIVDLAQRLDLVTIGESVENAETAELLRKMGVTWGQGYYFGRPACEEPVARSA
jgi:diguanylate cyclase (GGDEF)-like protein